MKKASFYQSLVLLSVVILIMTVSMLTYYKSTENGFVWDTLHYLYHHPFYLSSLAYDHVIWMFASLNVANWHPLTWLSWAIDYQIYGGFITWGYHLTSIVLHSINTALLFVVTLVIFGLNTTGSGGYPWRTDKLALVAACLAALLFGVHPQHVESVTWVAERKDLLCQLFMLLSLLAYVKYVSHPGGRNKLWFNTSLFLFSLAVMSKPMAVTFPVVLLLIDVYPLRRSVFLSPLNKAIKQTSTYNLLREKLPFFLLTILLILLTLKAQQVALVETPLILRVLNAFHSILFYLAKLLVPLHFSPHYPYFIDVGDAINWKAFMPMLGVLGISAACLFAWFRGKHAWLIAWLFYLVTLSPVLGLIQVGEQGAADRYTYFPTLPVYILAGVGILALLEKSGATRRWLIILPVLPVLVLLAHQTSVQIPVWKSPLSLWQHAVKTSPDSRLAQFNLGVTHLNGGDYEAAAHRFETAGQLERKPGKALAWRALTYLYLERHQPALAAHTELLAVSGSRVDLMADQNCIKYNIGWISAHQGKLEDAEKFFRQVEGQSIPGSSVRPWLDWLDTKPVSATETVPDEALPEFCEVLMPRMKVVKPSDFSPVSN